MPGMPDETDPDLRRSLTRRRASASRARIEERQARLEAEIRAEVAALYAEGWSYRDIGGLWDKSHTWVARKLATGGDSGGPSAA